MVEELEMVFSPRVLVVILFVGVTFVLGGCAHTQQSVTYTYIQHSANVVISPRINEMNIDILICFSFFSEYHRVS